MNKLLSIFLILSVVLLCFSGCARAFEPGGEINTTYDGVYITVDGVDESGDSPVLEVVWHNETGSTVTFGLWYTIEFLDGGEWKNIQIADFAIPDIACMLVGDKTVTQRYTTKYFLMLREGIYRIRTEFYISEENIGSQSAWATFEVSYL